MPGSYGLQWGVALGTRRDRLTPTPLTDRSDSPRTTQVGVCVEQGLEYTVQYVLNSGVAQELLFVWHWLLHNR